MAGLILPMKFRCSSLASALRVTRAACLGQVLITARQPDSAAGLHVHVAVSRRRQHLEQFIGCCVLRQEIGSDPPAQVNAPDIFA
jgi:hypothetical protein